MGNQVPVSNNTLDSAKFQKFVAKLTRRFMKDLDSPKAHQVLKLFEENSFSELVNLKVNPDTYDSADTFMRDYAAVSFLSKAEFLPTGIDTRAVALKKFSEAEDDCYITNKQLHFRISQENLSVQLILKSARRKVDAILGDVPSVAEYNYNFGPGATSAVSGSSVCLANKLQSTFVIPRKAIGLFSTMVENNHHAISASQNERGALTVATALKFTVQEHNSLTFVPKNAKTDRAICIEPHSLVPLQKGTGDHIRLRLKLSGLDLNRAPDINQALARQGSIDGSYATIDLSSASDTISYSTVAYLVPPKWLEFLDAQRCEFTRTPQLLERGFEHAGKFYIHNEKFSSMGNGFTFELESLIFLALARACLEAIDDKGFCSVFGDDIVISKQAAELLIYILNLLGFTVNPDKTFLDGPFRESCGHDYFQGHNVRPYFFKKVCNYESDKFGVANGIRAFSVRSAGWPYNLSDSRYRRSWLLVVSSLPDHLRLFGPSYLGNQVIASPRRECVAGMSKSFGSGYGTIRTVNPVFKQLKLSKFRANTVIAAALKGVRPLFSLRGEPIGHLFGRVTSSCWSWDDTMWS